MSTPPLPPRAKDRLAGRERAAVVALTIVLLTACDADSSDDATRSTPEPVATSTASSTPKSLGTPGATRTTGGIYRATTPCDAITRPVPAMAPGAQCEMATWTLNLRGDGRYALDAAYGMSEPNTLGMRHGGTSVSLAGTWSSEQDLITLATGNPGVAVRLLQVGSDLLHLVGADGRLLVGNAAWSYTLNRAGEAGRHAAVVASTYDEPGGIRGGVFEGRTPCTAEVKAFTADLVPGCSRLKWRLTLRQSAGGQPAGYVSGVVGRPDATKGEWRIRRDLAGFPGAVVYEIRPSGSRQWLALLLVGGKNLFMLGPDRQLLVGDENWSYTLSRTG